jgi:hypothetical protein
MPGQNFGLALALVPKPISHGFLASGQSQNITSSGNTRGNGQCAGKSM